MEIGKLRFIKSIAVLSISLLQGCYSQELSAPAGKCDSDCTIIEGRFVTEDGSIPIEGVELKLTWSTPSAVGWGLGGEDRLIAKSKTGPQGEYSFSFYLKDRELTEGEIYISYNESSDRYYLLYGYNFLSFGRISRRDTVILRNCYLPTKADLNIIVTNPEIITGERNLSIGIRGEGIAHELYLNEGFGNMKSDTIVFGVANTLNYIFIRKRLDSNTFINSEDSIFVQKDQLNIYEVTF